MSVTRPLRCQNRLVLRLFVALAGGCICCLLARPALAQTEPITDTVLIPILPSGDTPGGTIFLPVITGSEDPTPQSEPVFGVSGEVRPNPAGGEQFVTANGLTFGLVGATPAIDDELARLAALTPPPSAKVWGTLYRSADTGAAFIVVTQITVGEEITPTATPRVTPRVTPRATPTVTPTVTRATPTRTPTVTPVVPRTPALTPQPTATPSPTVDAAPALAVGRFDAVNLRAVPGTGDARTGVILRGQECPILGQYGGGAWLQVECPGGTGWVQPQFVTTSGNLGSVPDITPVPTPTPTITPTITPTPTSTPYVFRGWSMLVYNNAQLQGVPVTADDVPNVDFNWGTGGPPGVLPDFFSVAFERTIDFAPGFYFITASADDGMRVFLDGRLIIDQWFGPAGKNIRLGRALSGSHAIRIEYVEISGSAHVRFAYNLGPTPLRWTAAFSGLADATGSDPFVQQEADGGAFQLDYDWGTGSPAVAPAEGWTGRWTGIFSFDGGNYLFRANAKDAVRLYLDGQLVLDRWATYSYGEVSNRFVGVGPGEHTIVVEYYNYVGDASLRVWWWREGTGGPSPQ